MLIGLVELVMMTYSAGYTLIRVVVCRMASVDCLCHISIFVLRTRMGPKWRDQGNGRMLEGSSLGYLLHV